MEEFERITLDCWTALGNPERTRRDHLSSKIKPQGGQGFDLRPDTGQEIGFKTKSSQELEI